MSLFNELKRRNVFKAVVGYIITAWLVLQIADVVLNNIEAPGWIFQVLMLFLGLGYFAYDKFVVAGDRKTALLVAAMPERVDT
jgi:hypothetical protein